MKKPKDIDEYKPWARANLGTDFDSEAYANIFEINAKNSLIDSQRHPFFSGLDAQLAAWSENYRKRTAAELLMTTAPLAMQMKSYASAVNKSFRLNVLRNSNFPSPPDKGWLTTDNLLLAINDTLRGTIVCRFIDGPAYVARALGKYAKSMGLKHRSYSQQRDAGYYAYHFYVWLPLHFFDIDWKGVEAPLQIEIQITTQLQEVLKDMTHQFYELDRLRDSASGVWKWEYSTSRFKIGYLSHSLHLLESVIVETRDTERKRSIRRKK
jgi:ppGpp synthetase/RelA/SpoT-type nucleotidyltranferase